MADMSVFIAKHQTDWGKCCLCQTEKKDEDLKSPPPDSKGKDGYTNIATNVPQFHAMNQLPLILDPSRLDEGCGIETTLRKRQAKYHQSCRLMFNNTKLDRARKRSSAAPRASEEVPSKSRRSSLEIEKCILCDSETPKSDLRQAMTMNIDRRLNECARTLNDGKLLATLSAGDAVAQELKYHKNCLSSLYYRESAYLSKLDDQENCDSLENEVYPLVFSELVTFIVESKFNATEPKVFCLADLVKMFKQRLEQFGVSPFMSTVHSTRLKDRLLAEIPEIEAHESGRDILLAFKKDIGPALSKASKFSDAIVLSKAASILRRLMLGHETSFDGRFKEGCVERSVPPALLQFVCMIEHGVDIKSQLQFGASKTDSTMAQLLQYNCFSKSKESSVTPRHTKEREPPFPIFMGMSVYAKTRKKILVELLSEHGLCIPYKRVLEVSAQLGDAAVGRFIDEGVVCPSILRKGLFTTAAMDNIDHNPTSTTSASSFHGTSISLFQHPSSGNEGQKRDPFSIRNTKVKKVPELPDSYTNVPPAVLMGKTSPPKSENRDFQPIQNQTLQLHCEFEWLEKVCLAETLDERVNVTWSAHHASKERSLAFEVTIASLLPLLRESAQSVATIRHVMDKVKDTIAYLNPGQVVVLTADQPLYALAKQIQWRWPDKYGENKIVMMFGGLHIEMAALNSIGTFLQASGWTDALTEADIASSGTAQSFLSVSSVTKTRKAHQVTACALYKLLTDSYNLYCTETDDEPERLSLEQWCEKRAEESPQFNYWYVVLTMELTILSFIRSLRETNFHLYTQALAALIPYFFANNNTNYARWLPIHLRDMLQLDVQHPELSREFHAGKFVVFRSKRPFTAMAIDQAHEQANAIIKGDGGAVGVTEDPSALRRWMVAGPEVSRLASEYEALFDNKDVKESVKHQEQTAKTQNTFIEQVENMYKVIKEMGNPFQEDSKDLLSLDTKVIASAGAIEILSKHVPNGRERFTKFMNELEADDTCSFYSPIKKSKLNFFEQKTLPASGEVKQRVLKDDCRLFSKLFISCQSRECDLLDFFKHENQSFPAALSDNGSLYGCQKSILTTILEATAINSETVPNATSIVIDGSALVNALPPRMSKTFEDYAALEVVPKVQRYASQYNRTDIVFDVYKVDSLKAEARLKRGQGNRRRVTHKGKLPQNWRSFLRDNDNKTDLFKFLADKITESCLQNVVIVSKEDSAVSNQDSLPEGLVPCNHEEADTRMLVHVKHAVNQGHRNIILKANDTDVLVIAVNTYSALSDLGLENLWIEYGQGASVRWIPIQDIAKSIGNKTNGIAFFHAFTGCDTVSAFRGKGKKAAWQTWNVFPQIGDVFSKLSKYPLAITPGDIEALEKFVIAMYDRSSSAVDIHVARLDMFARKQRQYDAIPPTREALCQHIKRAAYQAGCIWGQSLECSMAVINPAEWGWRKQNNIWQVFWTNLHPIAESCKELTKCGCKTDCSGRCKCYRFGLACTDLCSCMCEN